MPAISSKKPTKDQLKELRSIKQAEIKLVREMAKKDLWFLINEVLWPEDASYHYQETLHKPLCEFVTTNAKPGCRKLILMPRKHRKTYIVSVAHTVQRILADPNIRVLIISGLDKTAKHFLGVIKRVFQYNEGIIKYFPEFHVSANKNFGNETEFTHPLRTKHQLADPTVRASYLGAPLAGSRCDILICDDPIEKKHVTTPEQADKALYHFNDLIPLVDESDLYEMVFISGTRWSFNDVYGAILGENRGEEAEVEVFEEKVYETIVRHCLEDKDGNPDINGTPIFHQRFTRTRLLQILAEYSRDVKRGEEDWWKQLMNVCVSPTGKKFEEAWFDNWVPRLPGNIIFSAIGIDSATKDEQVIMRGDYTGALVGHMDGYGHLYLTDAIHSAALKSPDLMRELKLKSQKHNTFNLIKEKVGEEMFFGMVKESFLNANLPINTIPCSVRGQGKKVVRIVEALQQPFMDGKIHFVGDPHKKTGFPYAIWKTLMNECVHIGQWAHDDLADALSLFFHKDVRIQPQQLYAKEWTIPRNARLPQKSTSRTHIGYQGWRTKSPTSPTTNEDGYDAYITDALKN